MQSEKGPYVTAYEEVKRSTTFRVNNLVEPLPETITETEELLPEKTETKTGTQQSEDANDITQKAIPTSGDDLEQVAEEKANLEEANRKIARGKMKKEEFLERFSAVYGNNSLPKELKTALSIAFNNCNVLCADDSTAPAKGMEDAIRKVSELCVVMESVAGALEANDEGDNQEALLEAARFGPLARLAKEPVSGPGLEDPGNRAAAMAQILTQFKEHPELTLTALEVALNAEHPEVIAMGVQVLGPLQADGFKNSCKDAKLVNKMAKNALAMGGHFGGDYFKDMNQLN